MNIDISRIPFSKYGSYISIMEDQAKNELIIQNIKRKWGDEKTFRLYFCKNKKKVKYRMEVLPWEIRITSMAGEGRIYLKDDHGLVIESRGLEVSLEAVKGLNIFGYKQKEGLYKLMVPLGALNITMDVIKGNANEEFIRVVENNNQISKSNLVHVLPQAEHIQIYIRFTPREVEYIRPVLSPETDIAQVREEWMNFFSKMPEVPEDRKEFAMILWYNIWSCYVRAEGNFKYDAVLMSKGSMGAVWSWDHCFNALAIAKKNLAAGLEQFFLMFEMQSEIGNMPDCITADTVYWQVSKPPIHGWCFHRILNDNRLEPQVLEKAYRYLEKWTEWHFCFRDTDQDGIPAYNIGCDSGWDNSTLFDLCEPLETPDLSSFLFLQMKTLEKIAEMSGWNEKALYWSKRAEILFTRFFEHLWQEDGFVAKTSKTHSYDPKPTSMLILMPIVLGEYMPKDKMDLLTSRLEHEFITPYGVATEGLTSSKYCSDGYWRGPIWAPVTYLLADGLRRVGREELAYRIARSFCDMVQNSNGSYENYDALTGQGLRDQGYTWTASVAILLMNEFLLNTEGGCSL